MEIPVRRPTFQSNWMAAAAFAIAVCALCSIGWAAVEQTSPNAASPQPVRPTRKPVSAAPQPPSPEEQVKLVEDVRHYALNYAHGLPDFICLEQNRRYSDTTGMEAWRLVDVLTARLSFFNRQEEYKLVSQNGRAVTDASYVTVDGAVSMGDFGSSMYDIFDPASHATFVWKRWTTLRGRLTHVFSYRIPLEFSKYTLEWGERESGVQKIKVGYRGSIFVDKDLSTIIRIDQEAVNIPPSFPIRQAQETLDYDFTKIGDGEFFLPLVATLEMHSRNDISTKNVKEFQLYQKFSTDAVIQFDGQVMPPLPDDKTKEQAPRKSK
jgi:hypothetical protein